MIRTLHRYGWRGCVAAAVLLAAGGVVAQTVYKSVDEKGNVIYSESPPTKSKNGAIKSTKELAIDPNQNVMPATPVSNTPSSSGADTGGAAAASDIATARAALEEAEANLKAGSETQPGDFIGRAGGGVGPSPQRLQRLQELQRAVDEAREQLRQAGG
ncbi:MAG: DUF4124 domain-containing protein [Spongiibacteraceae bacterium]